MRSTLAVAARVPGVRGALLLGHGRLIRHRPWMQPHPFDRQHGTDTSGYLPPWIISTGHGSERHSSGYAGCQPSCLRAALAVVPVSPRFSFLDLGCGKGRALILASERPFARVQGVELAPLLVRTARANAAIIARAHPDRPPITVTQGDATALALPDGGCVVFMYHSFGRPVVSRIVAALVREAAGREVFFIYENPVHGDLLDAAPGFARFHASTVPCEPAERGLAPDAEDTVVIWRAGGPPREAQDGADRPIRVTKPDWRAELA